MRNKHKVIFTLNFRPDIFHIIGLFSIQDITYSRYIILFFWISHETLWKIHFAHTCNRC